MSVFDGSVYRLRARYADGTEGERWASTDRGAQEAAAGMLLHGALAIEAGEVHFVSNGGDRLNLSFGDYWDEGEED